MPKATLIDLPLLAARSWLSAQYGEAKGCPGMELDRYGRSVGYRLAKRMRPTLLRPAVRLLLNPCSITRYFEFHYVIKHLASPGTYLDVGSPRLLSFFVAEKGLGDVTIINPDLDDITETDLIARHLRIPVRCYHRAIHQVTDLRAMFGGTYSVSVIEHVSGDYDDTEAIKMMYAATMPGGMLIVTVPTDRTFYEQFETSKRYDTAPAVVEGKFLFQRVYSYSALKTRLFDALPVTPTDVTWFGERQQGRFMSYNDRWLEDGLRCTVDDPREIADHWAVYSSWDDMPGHGVCGFCIKKPH